jgi:hypothetical protein
MMYTDESLSDIMKNSNIKQGLDVYTLYILVFIFVCLVTCELLRSISFHFIFFFTTQLVRKDYVVQV